MPNSCLHLTQIIDMLDGMTKKFDKPYIVFYPTVSRDGMPFPINKFVRDTQGRHYQESRAWRGNLLVAKYQDAQFSSMMDASIADFPLIKNWLTTHHMI